MVNTLKPKKKKTKKKSGTVGKVFRICKLFETRQPQGKRKCQLAVNCVIFSVILKAIFVYQEPINHIATLYIYNHPIIICYYVILENFLTLSFVYHLTIEGGAKAMRLSF